jgi:ribA/ribD-fused uncharacterized protein
MAEREEKTQAAVDQGQGQGQKEQINLPPPGLPYSKEQIEKMKTFFNRRKKNPANYRFSKKGDLETLSKTGEVEGTIYVKSYVPLTPGEREFREQARLDRISAIEEEYEAVLISLRTAIESGNRRDILEINTRVSEIDRKRNAARSALRETMTIDNPVTKEILFEEANETRRLLGKEKDPFDKKLVRLSLRDFALYDFYGKYVDKEDAPDAAAAATANSATTFQETDYHKKLKDGRIARIFFEESIPLHGFLSPMWPVEFTLDETRYFTAIQAYEAERAKELKMEKLRQDILNTRKPRTIRILTKKVTDHPADARGLWMKILTAVYQQHPELMEKLAATGSDTLVYADPREGPSGIGLSEKDAGVLDPTKWKGENLVGIALETIRTRSREDTLEESAEGPVKESVITEEEQKKAKTAAIINAARNRVKFRGGGA